jgi:hypothetical protein
MLATQSKREFTKARHAQRREVVKACRAVTKGTEWRSNQGALFAERGGWFLAAHEMTDVASEQTKVRLVVKPMAIDPIFWDIVGHPELREQPLSFRYFGAMKCALLILEEPHVSEDGGPIAIAARMLDLGEQKLTEIATSWTADDFLSRIGNPAKPDQHFVTRIATLLAVERFGEAQALCADSDARGKTGGFVSLTRGTFNQMVSRWIAANSLVDKS